MDTPPRVSVIIAVKNGHSNVAAWLRALKEAGDEIEVLFACAGHIPLAVKEAKAKAFSRDESTLIPVLWGEGISLARGERVALTTAQFVPDKNWFARLARSDLGEWVGIGGAIENAPDSTALNWAIFFLRYSAFAPPLAAGEAEDIAADNAIYDRKSVVAYPRLLKDGFWEPSFHRRFHGEGKKLRIDPDLLLIHKGTLNPREFIAQRHLHGRAYGFDRARRVGKCANSVLLLSSPLVPPLLLIRIMARLLKKPQYLSKMFKSLLWLIVFTCAWASGEALGYGTGLAEKFRNRPSKMAHE